MTIPTGQCSWLGPAGRQGRLRAELMACCVQSKRSWRSACPERGIEPLRRQAVPGTDTLVTEFEKITLEDDFDVPAR